MHPLLFLLGFVAILVAIVAFVIFLIKIVIFLINRRKFPRYSLITLVVSVAIFSSILVYHQFFFTFNMIDRESMQEGMEVTSPSGNYTANVYYELYGGAAGGVNVWVEVTNHENASSKVIYYADAKQNVWISWADDERLSITNTGGSSRENSSRSVVLQVEKEIYHENGLACQSVLMKKQYETCVQAVQ